LNGTVTSKGEKKKRNNTHQEKEKRKNRAKGHLIFEGHKTFKRSGANPLDKEKKKGEGDDE